jgi:H+/Cl- antiporter ClcA
MDWVILVYGVIFGAMGVYLLTLWQRVQQVNRELKSKDQSK